MLSLLPASSRGFCEAALKHQFTDHKKDWTSAFSHSSHRDHKGKAGRKHKAFFVSKTMEREVNKQPEISSMTAIESSNDFDYLFIFSPCRETQHMQGI